MTADLQEFLNKRQSILTARFESGDVDSILKMYHKDIDFTDHAWQADHLNYSRLTEFLKGTYATVPGLKLDTHAVHGNKEFSVWEWTLKLKATIDDPVRHMSKGKESWLRGCSLHWWRLKEGADSDEPESWQLVKEGDYACPCPVSSE